MKRYQFDTRQGVTLIGITLLCAILAFEVFNFDTTRFALLHLFGPQTFAGVSWAAILAVAFCGIDFAGLLHLCLPSIHNSERPTAAWALFTAWLLGATLNAIATWYAVGITLLSHDIGGSLLTREQLLFYAPLLVAALVWLTRILFIMALSLLGSALLPTLYEAEGQPMRAGRLRPAPPVQQRAPTLNGVE